MIPRFIANDGSQPPSTTAVPLVPVALNKGVLTRWLSPAISIAILLAALWQLRSVDFAQLVRMVPRSAGFWLLFVGGYLITPASEWIIFRRLWQLPARGFVALLRKRISNEIVLGYSGELYFYGWARRHATMVGAPFGAIKDVAILSALVANLCTLVLAMATWRLFAGTPFGFDTRLVAVSAACMTIPSVTAFLLRKRLFTLRQPELIRIAVIHFVRIVATTVAAALLWASVLPSAPLTWWLALATLRLLVSRLPLLPNKDIVFAGLVAFTVGNASGVTAVMTMIAAIWLATHLLLGVVLAAYELATERAR
ncbi:hypothetical protein Q5H91_10220 [Sphingomonas sp. KR1UV-12]|uniref:Flippase-like domain-containing protein n=1 Tax=Sphingomonas aurea TaxID=3063994 RepID=A0ABT9EKT9_9SPHN|nr:hypothetical protein [Sphingomonas sp. KR1UV-12]MDP1027588.1 hypothetical protein [Sphingomonas sp. KR1UV-12]